MKAGDNSKAKIAIYQNLVKDKITIQFLQAANEAEIEFFDAGAKKILSVQKKNTTRTISISIARFNPGLYLLSVTNLVTGKIMTKKFLKK